MVAVSQSEVIRANMFKGMTHLLHRTVVHSLTGCNDHA